jgi:hypothetical protein
MLTDVGQALDPEGQEEEEEDLGEKSQKKRENFVHPKSRSKLGEGKISTQRECTDLTLSYSSKINDYLYHQRVSPPLKKTP